MTGSDVIGASWPVCRKTDRAGRHFLANSRPALRDGASAFWHWSCVNPFIPEKPAQPMTIAETYRRITSAEAATLIQAEAGISIFDVRDLASYRLGHVADAAHLTEDRLPAWFRRLPREQPVLIYCYKGNASQAYAQMFADFHFARVFSVDGGYEPLAAALAAA